jgi:hypothetical protein
MSTQKRKPRFNAESITKEELISIIESSPSMQVAAERLGTNRRKLGNLREKHAIVHISANKYKKEEKKLSYQELLKYNEEIRNSDPLYIRQQMLEKLKNNKKDNEESNLSTVSGFMKHFGEKKIYELDRTELTPVRPVEEITLQKEEKKSDLDKIIEDIKQHEKVAMNFADEAYEDWTKQRDIAVATTFAKTTKRKTHVVIPDCQIKSDVDMTFLEWIGKYIAEVKPDRIINIGDFADMPCLYNYKKESFDANDYKEDVKSAKDGMEILMNPLREAMRNDPTWKPTFDLTLGNHEERIIRVSKNDKKIGAFLSIDDLDYKRYGWTVHDYLKPVVLDDIAYAHFFTSTLMGQPIATAKNLLNKKHMSCVMGHRQEWEMARDSKPDGVGIVGLIAGACYTYDPEYLGPQGNNYSRQIWVLEDIEKGHFNPRRVDLKQLQEIYGG